MIKFTMNAKELKIMMDKVMTAVNKKVSVPSLKRLYFSIDDKGILKILSTDIDHYVEVRTKNVYQTETCIHSLYIKRIPHQLMNGCRLSVILQRDLRLDVAGIVALDHLLLIYQ